MRKIVYFVIIVGVLLGCGERQEYRETLSRAEAVMNDHPDSALLILDSLGQHEKEFGRHFRMQYLLHRTNAENKAYLTFTSDSVIKRVVNYYDGWFHSSNDRLLAHYLLGCVYRDLGEIPHAIDCYNDAITKADTTTDDCDYATLGCVYTQMANLYHKQLLLSKEVEARKKAFHFFLCVKDTFNAIYHQGMIGGAYIMLNKRDSAEILLRKAVDFLQNHGHIHDALQTSTMLMFLYVDQPERLSDLKNLIDVYEKNFNLFDSHHNLPPSKRQYYYYKGKYFEGVHQLDSAEYYYRKIYRPNMSYMSIEPMYKGLLNVFSKKHEVDSLVKYCQLYGTANDSSVIIKDRELTAQLSIGYDYNYYKTQSLINKNKALWGVIAFSITFLLLIILIMAIVYIVKRFRKAQVQQQKIHIEKQEELLKIHQHEKDVLKQTFLQKQQQTKIEFEKQLAQLQLKQEKELDRVKKKELSRKFFNNDIVLFS